MNAMICLASTKSFNFDLSDRHCSSQFKSYSRLWTRSSVTYVSLSYWLLLENVITFVLIVALDALFWHFYCSLILFIGPLLDHIYGTLSRITSEPSTVTLPSSHISSLTSSQLLFLFLLATSDHLPRLWFAQLIFCARNKLLITLHYINF